MENFESGIHVAPKVETVGSLQWQMNGRGKTYILRGPELHGIILWSNVETGAFICQS
jgi:hypothetical protein